MNYLRILVGRFLKWLLGRVWHLSRWPLLKIQWWQNCKKINLWYNTTFCFKWDLTYWRQHHNKMLKTGWQLSNLTAFYAGL